MRYRIVRMYFRDEYPSRIVKSGLTLAEAQEHCQSPEASYKTATSAAARRRTAERGPWFDGYEEDLAKRRRR